MWTILWKGSDEDIETERAEATGVDVVGSAARPMGAGRLAGPWHEREARVMGRA
jgi:hypothetical protein